MASGYTATSTDLGNLTYAFAETHAEASGSSLRWSSGVTKVARVGADEYESLADAVSAANLLEDATVELIHDAMIGSRICVNSTMTITSAGNSPFTVTRASSDAGFDVGKDGEGTVVLTKDVTLTFSDIIIDGGAIWTSDSIESYDNTGIGEGQPLFTAVGTGNVSVLDPTLCGKLVFGAGTEIRNQAGQVVFLDYHSRFVFDYGAKMHDCRYISSASGTHHLFECRTASFLFAGEVRNCSAKETTTSTVSSENYSLFFIDRAGSNYYGAASESSMTNGLITSCNFKSGAIYPYHTSFTMSGGEISNNKGGNGVAIHCYWNGARTLNLCGGVITNNTVDAVGAGAAIFVSTLKSAQEADPPNYHNCLRLSGSIVIKDNWFKNWQGTRKRNIYSSQEHLYGADYNPAFNVIISGPLTGEVQVTWPEGTTDSNAGSFHTLAQVLDVPFGTVVSDEYIPTQSDAHHMVYEGNPVERKHVIGRVDRANGKLVWGLTGKETLFMLK